MSKKIILKDFNEVQLLPLTTTEQVLIDPQNNTTLDTELLNINEKIVTKVTYEEVGEINPTINVNSLAPYPIGSIYLSANPINPTNLFGGTWEQIFDITGIPEAYAWKRVADPITITNPIYGVEWVNDNTTEMTRTDNSVGLGFSIDQETGAIYSDFNNRFPWNEATIVYDNYGNKFIRMPEMYFRISVDSNNAINSCAVAKKPSGDGSWYKVESFEYGCYGGSVSDSLLKSVSNVDRSVSVSLSSFRTYATNYGNDINLNNKQYFHLDLYHKSVMNCLWWIEFATKNSRSIMEGRCVNSGNLGGASVRPTGGTDNISTPSGYELDYGQMRWHYIEDFIGNLYEWVDGIFAYASAETTYQYATSKIVDYSDSTTNKTSLTGNEISSGVLGYLFNTSYPFLIIPFIGGASTYNNGFCCYTNTSGRYTSYNLYIGSHYNDGDKNKGIGTYIIIGAGSTNATISGRLMRKDNK